MRPTSIDIDGQGWTTDQVLTKEDCDAAEIYLSDAVSKINSQLSDPERTDPEWRRTAGVALRKKRQAMQIIQRKRGELNASKRQWAGRFVEEIKVNYPDIYTNVVGQL